MQARTLLAITSVLLLLAVLLNFWLAAYVIWLTLPFALMAFAGVGLAIYCGWRNGIWIFIGANLLLMLYSIIMLCIISGRGGFQLHPLDMTWNIIQISVETLCIALAVWVLIELNMEESSKRT